LTTLAGVGLVLALVIAAAGSFELLQLQAFGRHGYLKDFFVKSAGAGIGVMCGALMTRLGKRLLHFSHSLRT